MGENLVANGLSRGSSAPGQRIRDRGAWSCEPHPFRSYVSGVARSDERSAPQASAAALQPLAMRQNW